jgi:iron donor protein CyaY
LAFGRWLLVVGRWPHLFVVLEDVTPLEAAFFKKSAAIAMANDQRERPTTIQDYNSPMLDENEFRKRAENALESLKQSLIAAEESAEIEVEDQAGALHVSFEDGTRFVISPNAPVRQIWISALSTSFKLDWSEAEQDFVLPKTGERLKPLAARLINQQLGEEAVTLA